MASTGLKAWRGWLLKVALGALACVPLAQAQSAGPDAAALAFGSRSYVWNGMTPEQVQVLKLSGDPLRGQEAYRACQGCHRRDGAGRPDGSYPRLAGQHAVVIVKQVTDTRAGIRVNPKMAPFSSEHAVSLQEIADIAVYLSTRSGGFTVGQGPPDIAPGGAAMYTRLGCADCHGAAGQGNEAKVYPVVAAQHFPYLLRELEYVRDGQRGNSHPDMVKSLKGRSTQDLQALASYMSRLPDPGASRR